MISDMRTLAGAAVNTVCQLCDVYVRACMCAHVCVHVYVCVCMCVSEFCAHKAPLIAQGEPSRESGRHRLLEAKTQRSQGGAHRNGVISSLLPSDALGIAWCTGLDIIPLKNSCPS